MRVIPPNSKQEPQTLDAEEVKEQGAPKEPTEQPKNKFMDYVDEYEEALKAFMSSLIDKKYFSSFAVCQKMLEDHVENVKKLVDTFNCEKSH